MSFSRKTVTDLLFGVQMLGAVVSCSAQGWRSLHDVSGVSIAQFTFAGAFTALNLLLVLGTHSKNPTRGTRQLLATYATWTIFISAIAVAVATNAEYRWSLQDTVITAIAFAGVLGSLLAMVLLKRSVRDPMTLSLLALSCKALPQLLLVWTILEQGGSGLPATTVIVGHMTILLRLGQVFLTAKQDGWDRTKVWLTISESGAEISWLAATAAWLWVL